MRKSFAVMPLSIRRAEPADSEAISILINSVAHFFTINENGVGAEAFLQTITTQAIHGYITAPTFGYFVAVQENQIIGVIALREAKHLFHLFVSPSYQRKGVAAQLWQFARQSSNATSISVNSTPIAVPVYERFGFQITGPRVEKIGIAYVPMLWRHNEG